jgi:siroheme synthase (precorrin-2 oxidase/ferrochelatase)
LIEKYASDVVEATQAGSAVADRLRIEIMDHLTEAMEDVAEADRAEMDPVARLRAVINDFGPQEVMAGDYREVIAESRWRHLRWTVVAGIGLTFLAMRIRPYILEPGWREDLMQS